MVWIRGKAAITLKDVLTGEVERWEGHNAIVDDGLNLLLERLIGTAGASPMAYLAVGSGTGSFPGSESAMYNEDYRKAITTCSVSGNVGVWMTYFSTAEANGTIRELGLFNAPSGGVMFAHAKVDPARVKTSGKEMIVTIQHTLSRA
jgi:hypothetical protein